MNKSQARERSVFWARRESPKHPEDKDAEKSFNTLFKAAPPSKRCRYTTNKISELFVCIPGRVLLRGKILKTLESALLNHWGRNELLFVDKSIGSGEISQMQPFIGLEELRIRMSLWLD